MKITPYNGTLLYEKHEHASEFSYLGPQINCNNSTNNDNHARILSSNQC